MRQLHNTIILLYLNCIIIIFIIIIIIHHIIMNDDYDDEDMIIPIARQMFRNDLLNNGHQQLFIHILQDVPPSIPNSILLQLKNIHNTRAR